MPTERRYQILLGILAVWVFIDWGERRLLEAKFERFITLSQLSDARKACTLQFAKEHEEALDESKWSFRHMKWGIAPASWPFNYFKFGDNWEVHNASMEMVFSYELAPDARHVCNYGIRGRPQVWKSNQ